MKKLYNQYRTPLAIGVVLLTLLLGFVYWGGDDYRQSEKYKLQENTTTDLANVFSEMLGTEMYQNKDIKHETYVMSVKVPKVWTNPDTGNRIEITPELMETLFFSVAGELDHLSVTNCSPTSNNYSDETDFSLECSLQWGPYSTVAVYKTMASEIDFIITTDKVHFK